MFDGLLIKIFPVLHDYILRYIDANLATFFSSFRLKVA